MSFDWKITEHNHGDSGKCKAYPFFASVQDCDGDYTTWSVRRHKEEIASGTVHHEDVTHEDGDFAQAQAACEKIMLAEIVKHITRLMVNVNELKLVLGEPVYADV